MKKHILVTGGAGFIGSHTVDLLVSKGFKVTIIDNLSTGKIGNLNRKAKFIKCDLADIERHASKLKNIDAVMHCAAQISVSKSLEDPAHDAQVNIIGTLKLLELCRKLKIKKFVFASSAAVYGNPPKSELPLKESCKAVPESPYGVAKKTIEDYLHFYNLTYGMEYVCLRYSNVYGPRQNDLGEAGVITVFITRLIEGNQPAIFGDGKQTRDFVFVGDVARANVNALLKKADKRILNVSTKTQISINELVQKLILLSKSTVMPIHKAGREGEVRFSSLNNSAAKSTIMLAPTVKLEEGLKRTLSWFINSKKTKMSLSISSKNRNLYKGKNR